MRTITILIGAIILASAAGKCEVYHNREFGIIVPVPRGALLCPTPAGEHDHGPVFLLASKGPNDCPQSEHQRSIEIFASYNAADATWCLVPQVRVLRLDANLGPGRS